MGELACEDILGYDVTTESNEQLVARIMAWTRAPTGAAGCRWFACLNPHSAEQALHDAAFEQALHAADFLTPDGIGVVYASRLLGGSIRTRVTGSDIFLGTCAAMQAAGGGSCFFLGSSEEVLAAIRRRMAADYPAVEVAGTWSPPFRPQFTADDNARMIEAVNASGAQVLWVGLTAPKQEKWVHEHHAALNVAFAGPIGAVFDFYAGRIQRAGPVYQRLGLEWLPRLLQEPRRLWRRMGVSAPRFMARVVASRLRRGRSSGA